MPTYAELISTSKLHMLQSLVSMILVEMVFDSYFVGLTEHQALQLAQAESLVASLGKETHSDPTARCVLAWLTDAGGQQKKKK